MSIGVGWVGWVAAAGLMSKTEELLPSKQAFAG